MANLPPLQQNGWLTVPWTEYVRKDASAGATFASGWDGDQRATMQILVNWSDGLQAELDILGNSYFIPTYGGGVLSRTPAVQHPYKPSLRAERILQAQPMRWDGKQLVAFPYAPGSGGDFGHQSSWSFWHITIGFAVPNYTIITDTDLQLYYGGGEWNRYCVIEEDRKLETIVREAGTFVWQESSATGPTVGNAFNSPWGQTLNSMTATVIWKRVPRVGLFSLAGLGDWLIANVAGNIGLVHNGATALWGVSNGSAGPFFADANGSILRLVTAKALPIASPFLPFVQGLPWFKPNLFYDVRFVFHWWNPPAGALHWGHNLAPSPSDNLWYLVKTNQGGLIYPTGDLSKVFQLALA